MILQKQHIEFLKFLIASGFAAVVNIVSRVLFSIFLIYEIAVILAYIIGMITAYILSKKYVFETSGQTVKREFSGFVLINIVAVIQVWVISVGLYKWGLPLIGWTYEPALVAHICGVLSPVFTSYFGHKYISFRKKKIS